jgi:hypothetical protein
MAPRFLTILTGRNLPKIRQSHGPEPSIINEGTIADFTRVVERTGILERERIAATPQPGGVSGDRLREDQPCPRNITRLHYLAVTGKP